MRRRVAGRSPRARAAYTTSRPAIWTTSVFRRKELKADGRWGYCQFRVRCRTSPIDPRNGAGQRSGIAPGARPRRPDLRSDRTAGRAGTGGRRTPRPPTRRCGLAGRFHAGVRLSAKVPSRDGGEDRHRRCRGLPRGRGRGRRRRRGHHDAGAGPPARPRARTDRRHQLAARRPGAGACQPGGGGDDRRHPARVQLRPRRQRSRTVPPGAPGLPRLPLGQRPDGGTRPVHVQHAQRERGPGTGAGGGGGGRPRGPHEARHGHHVPDGADGRDDPTGHGRAPAARRPRGDGAPGPGGPGGPDHGGGRRRGLRRRRHASPSPPPRLPLPVQRRGGPTAQLRSASPCRTRANGNGRGWRTCGGGNPPEARARPGRKRGPAGNRQGLDSYRPHRENPVGPVRCPCTSTCRPRLPIPSRRRCRAP